MWGLHFRGILAKARERKVGEWVGGLLATLPHLPGGNTCQRRYEVRALSTWAERMRVNAHLLPSNSTSFHHPCLCLCLCLCLTHSVSVSVSVSVSLSHTHTHTLSLSQIQNWPPCATTRATSSINIGRNQQREAEQENHAQSRNTPRLSKKGRGFLSS